MNNIIVQLAGSNIFVGIESDDINEILLQYNSWYNWCATDGCLLWMKDEFPPYFAYIMSSEQKYKNYLFNVLENKFAIETGYEFEGNSHIERIKNQAQKQYNQLKKEIFLQQNTNIQNHKIIFDTEDNLKSREMLKNILNKYK